MINFYDPNMNIQFRHVAETVTVRSNQLQFCERSQRTDIAINVFQFRVPLLNKSIEMSSSSSKRLLESMAEVLPAVLAILKKQEKDYTLADFKSYKKTADLRSRHNRSSFVLYFKNTTTSS